MKIELNIAVPNLASALNHLEVHSVAEYVLFDDLLRPLVKLNSNSEIIPDIAEKWIASDNDKRYSFKIKDKLYFSDGTLITSDDVVFSIQELINKQNVIHGNVKRISSVKKIDVSNFEISFNESSPFFLTELLSPEYRIQKKGNTDYSITSGPYCLSEKNESSLTLKLNDFYPFEFKPKYETVIYNSYTNLNKDLTNYDIIWPQSAISPTEVDEIKKSNFYTYQFGLGFSYWFSLNPNSLSLEMRIEIKEKLDVALKKNQTLFNRDDLERSHQLFLPSGPGRLTKNDIKEITHSLKEKRAHNTTIPYLKVLLPQSADSEIKGILQDALERLEIHYYKDFSDFKELTSSKNFDLFLVNNDLSSVDLRPSLLVTFNHSRPLVLIEKNNNTISQLLKKIENEQNSINRNKDIKKVGEIVLRDVLVYPLFYKHGFILAKNGVELSMLNKSGAETFSWKIN